jgi:hypothetical protein
MNVVTHPQRAADRLALIRGGRFYVWLTLAALTVAALSLLYPSTPSYDPWSWLIWGRQILHGQLHIEGGSSWKPLPVIFTTVFALFGSAQPNLWLIVARAGAVISVLMSVKLTVRITWNLVARGRDAGWFSGLAWVGRIGAIAPAGLGGAIALVCTALTPTYPSNMMLGYSEGLMTAACLIAAERAWDGHHRQAFVLGLIPALDRPEVWIVWGPYGLWLMWRDRGARALVIGLGVLMLLLWVVPQNLGGGTTSGLFTHPLHNHSKHSAVNSSFPFWNELDHKVRPLVLERIELAALLLMAWTGFLVVSARRTLGNWRGAVREHAAAVAAALAGAFGFLWWILIAIETQAGFAGNPRYAVLGVMLINVSGCAAYGWACLGLARVAAAALSLVSRGWRGSRASSSRLARAGLPRTRGRAGSPQPVGAEVSASGWSWRVGVSTVVVLFVFVFIPERFTHRMPTISSLRHSLRYQARLREEVASLIKREGGPQKVISCGSVMANNLQITMVAWYLDVPIHWIQALKPYTPGELGPNVVFQDGVTSGAPQYPTPQQMQAWERGGSNYKIVKTDPVTLYMDCSPYSKT